MAIFNEKHSPAKLYMLSFAAVTIVTSLGCCQVSGVSAWAGVSHGTHPPFSRSRISHPELAPCHIYAPTISSTSFLKLFLSSASNVESEGDVTLPPPSEMKLRDIKEELKRMGVSYSDCFDRESLEKRLIEARSGEVPSAAADKSDGGVETQRVTRTSSEQTDAANVAQNQSQKASAPSADTTFDREAVLSDLRSLRVAELRTRLSSRNIRWANMIEKEDLVQALANAMEKSSNFSPSGKLSPGEVSDISDEDLSAELSGNAGTPLLLDVYATWCGPCQVLAPQLKMAASELGDAIRVAKIDSDKYPQWSSKLRVGGLPTLIVFDGSSGREVDRVEGALMKDGLVDLARRHIL